ncbi:MAG: hypothetical protein RIT45_3647 [Pseudomonadota bacterium]|jgi:ATP-dependent HslUV protease subunit HslV
MHATTILAVRKGGQVALAGDGQVTLGDAVVKGNARKVRRLHDGRVVAGFAGSTADAFTLFERFEARLKAHGQLRRAAVELAREWRTERALRRLEAMLLVADADEVLLISGSGDVLEPDPVLGPDGTPAGVAAAIGSGGRYAEAAARALVAHTDLAPLDVAREAMRIAGDICIYTNHNIVTETLGS